MASNQLAPLLFGALLLICLYGRTVALQDSAPTWVSSKAAHQPPASSCCCCLGWLLWLSPLLIVAALRLLWSYAKISRTVLVPEWSGSTVAHRGYRSAAQQNNSLVAESDDSFVPPVGGRRSRASSFASGSLLLIVPQPADPNNYNIPENSLLAYIYAHEHGAHAVEVDVALTKDHEIIVMHDNSFQRTMLLPPNDLREVHELTLAEVRALRYRRVTRQEYQIRDPRNRALQEQAKRVPTLEEIVQFCQQRKLRLMIESKEYAAPAVLQAKIAALYEQYDMYAWSYVATFNPIHLYQLRAKFPRIPTCLLYCRTLTEWYHEDNSKENLLPPWLNIWWIRRAADWVLWYYAPTLIADLIGASLVGPHNVLISPALVGSLRERGMVCDVWTVNDPLEKRWLKALGCIVTSDRLFSFEDESPFKEQEEERKKIREIMESAAKSSSTVAKPSPAPVVPVVPVVPVAPVVASPSPKLSPVASSAPSPVASPDIDASLDAIASSSTPPSTSPALGEQTSSESDLVMVEAEAPEEEEQQLQEDAPQPRSSPKKRASRRAD